LADRLHRREALSGVIFHATVDDHPKRHTACIRLAHVTSTADIDTSLGHTSLGAIGKPAIQYDKDRT
jgi:hypothetical protein